MKKSFRIIFALGLMMAAAACQRLNIDEPSPVLPSVSNDSHEGVWMETTPVYFDDSETKANLSVDETTGLSFTWEDGDAAGVYSSSGGFARFELFSGNGLTGARFTGSGFSLSDGETYNAFFPYDMSATQKGAIPLSYSGQVLRKDNDTESLLEKDFTFATAMAEDGSACFSFSHIGSFLRMTFSGLPAGLPVDEIKLVPMMKEMPQAMSLNLGTGMAEAASSSPVFTISGEGLNVPSNGILTAWAVMPPEGFKNDDFSVFIYSGDAVYSARHKGSSFSAGKAYRWEMNPVSPDESVSYGFSSVTEAGLSTVTSTVGSGEYSGITYIGGTSYAVVHDKLNGGGIVMYDITINDDGTIGPVATYIPSGTSSSAVTGLDNEGIAYVPSRGTLFVSSENEQSIKEYDMSGVPTGIQIDVPADMSSGNITSNKGFESLTYNAETGLFWTTTESPLPRDSFMPRLLRLQSFNDDLKPAGRFLYQTDAPSKNDTEASSASSYVFGVPALAALNDGRLIVMEREVFVSSGNTFEKAFNSFTVTKFYIVNPKEDASGILRKNLLLSFKTTPLSNFANYEGMCLGPILSDGSQTLILLPDSQNGSGGLTQEYIKVITIK